METAGSYTETIQSIVMPMKIEGSANISDVFSIFHDGGIVRCHEENGSLLLEVEIQYLAERISPAFRKFAVLLEDITPFSLQKGLFLEERS